MSVKLTIIGAKGLPSVGGTSGDAGSAKLDAFVVCKVGGVPNPLGTTGSVKDSANPSWNHTTDLIWTPGTDIEFQINDASTGTDQLIGTAVLSGASVTKSKHELPIVTATNGKQGLLEVEVKEMPAASATPPASASAATATAAPSTAGMPDPAAAGTAAPAGAGTTDPAAAGTAAPAPAATPAPAPAATPAPAPAATAAPAPAATAAPAPAATADAGKGAAAPAPAPKDPAPAPPPAKAPAPAKDAPAKDAPAKDAPAKDSKDSKDPKDSKDSKDSKAPEKMTMEQRRAWMDAHLEKVDARLERQRRAAVARPGAGRVSTSEAGRVSTFEPTPAAAGGAPGVRGSMASIAGAGPLDAAARVSPLASRAASPVASRRATAAPRPTSASAAGLAAAAVPQPPGYDLYAPGAAPAAARPTVAVKPPVTAIGVPSPGLSQDSLRPSDMAPATTPPKVVGSPPVTAIGVSSPGLAQDSLRCFGSLPNAGPAATRPSDNTHRLCGALPKGQSYVFGTPEQQLLGGMQSPTKPAVSPAPGAKVAYAAPTAGLNELIRPIDLWSTFLPGPHHAISTT